ncbi:MAG: hypothetical protein RIE73_16480 [Coleofasciculus sp. C1-SOL-03]
MIGVEWVICEYVYPIQILPHSQHIETDPKIPDQRELKRENLSF